MSMVQVLKRRTPSGGNDILFEQFPAVGDFRALETEEREAALWGTRRLVELSVALKKLGFRAFDCTFADYLMAAINGPEQDDLKPELLDLINSEDIAGALNYLRANLGTWVLLSVGLRGRGDKAYRIRISQNGAVEVPGGDKRDDALQVLRTVIQRG